MTLTRRAVLAGAALALPTILRGAEGRLRDLVPGWAEIRLAVPNSDSAKAYASYAQIAAQGHRFVSENFTKTSYTIPGAQPGRPADALISDFATFDAQRQALIAAGAQDPQFDLHGAYWHNSMSPALAMRLTNRPGDWQALVARLYDTQIAPGQFARFDINEVQRATHRQDAGYDFWRGPADQVRNGSLWYRAAEAAPWAHGPGYWWLAAAQAAQGGPAQVIYQDFNLESGRQWGTGAREFAPLGQEGQLAEVLKRRRVIDAVNYALVHGGRIDVLGLQAHLDPRRAVDETDLRLWLIGLAAMGVAPEITELDIAPARRGAPAPDIYLEALLERIFAGSTLARLGGWTGWAPQGKPRQLTILDRRGITPVGEAMVRAASSAPPPGQRNLAAPYRFYQLCYGMAGDIWRAARHHAAPGFDTKGNERGTKVARGSGGAVLPLTNARAQPGGPVAAIWRTGPGAPVQDSDPMRFSLALQWQMTARAVGPVLSLGSLRFELNADGLSAIRGGQVTRLGTVPPGPAALALSRDGAEITLLSSAQTEPVQIDWPDHTEQLIVMGDGQTESTLRATCLTLWQGPAPGIAALRQRARPIGSVMLRI